MVDTLKTSAQEPRGFLDGQMIIAMPGMTDPRFHQSVIFICAHSKDGAMGIIVNHPAKDLVLKELLLHLSLLGDGEAIHLPDAMADVPVLEGGPVEKSRGFVLHSSDYFIDEASLPIDDRLAMTITVDILKAIAEGSGPRQAVVSLGYAGWSPGQLEAEIQANGWLHCPADHGLIFDRDHATKYQRAMELIGIDPRMLSPETGHA